MARLPRIVIPNQPLHIMHRGNNRQNIFETDEDMQRIKDDITAALSKSKCQLHAYVIMTNHLHLLITPADKAQLAIFMQSMANRYVRYFNASRQRTGTIWEGRYKSCLIDSETYLFILYKYIEMNPVKANMVKNIEDYKWSSYAHNALGQTDGLITEHQQYKRLGKEKDLRYKNYRALFDALEMSEQNKQITEATLRGVVYGEKKFHTKIAKLVDRPTRPALHGGDRKSAGYRDQAG